MASIVAVLHNIRSTHNVGAIFRTADGAGIQKIFLCGVTPPPVDRYGKKNPKIAKVALGAEDNIAWEKCAAIERLLPKLKKGGYKLWAIEQDKKSVPYSSKKLSARGKIALILGTEVNGLPPAVLSQADAILEIPMRGKKESLNVSVAFGIVAYAVTSPDGG